jgi:hypothetical protein
MRANESFTPAFDGWFVPDARWQELREALAEKIAAAEANR